MGTCPCRHRRPDHEEWEMVGRPPPAGAVNPARPRPARGRLYALVRRLQKLLRLRWLWARIGAICNGQRALPPDVRGKIGQLRSYLGRVPLRRMARVFAHLERVWPGGKLEIIGAARGDAYRALCGLVVMRAHALREGRIEEANEIGRRLRLMRARYTPRPRR